MARLGDILVASGAISRHVLEHHLRTPHIRIGSILRAKSLVTSRSLAKALALQQELPFMHISASDVAPDMFIPRNLGHYVRHQYFPLRRLANGHLQIATPDPSPALNTILTSFYKTTIEILVVSMRDFTSTLGHIASSTLTRRATLNLRRGHKSLVADRVLVRSQMQGLTLFGVAIAGAFTFAPTDTWRVLTVMTNLFYIATLAFKIRLFRAGRIERNIIQQDAIDVEEIISKTPDSAWPHYTILVPLHHEQHIVISRLIRHLVALDYPEEKLSIKLICEADDTETIAAIKALRPPEMIEIMMVAPSFPRTKPKACNVALQQIRSEYLVIFDAEDAPHHRQLKRAAAMFLHIPQAIACLQTPLNYYNYKENLLTRLFAIEYSSLFRLTLPAMQRLDLPIPLGGTSNHIRVAVLKKIGGWDAFNVTEDADLGMRLAYFGYHTRLLPSLTLEEAPITLRAWMRQRSRWIKGYIQTWLVYMRNPAELRRRLGPRAYHGFQFFMGAPTLTFLIAPFFWIAFILHISGIASVPISTPLQWMCVATLLAGTMLQCVFAASTVHFEKWTGMGSAIAIYPFYWLLHSIASIWALWQLVIKPHKWEKTRHGESKCFVSQS
jgi:cellulose synthase/poly-beta-1,6-N-acetylglucosamine synthase-like glycosyltransferase